MCQIRLFFLLGILALTAVVGCAPQGATTTNSTTIGSRDFNLVAEKDSVLVSVLGLRSGETDLGKVSLNLLSLQTSSAIEGLIVQSRSTVTGEGIGVGVQFCFKIPPGKTEQVFSQLKFLETDPENTQLSVKSIDACSGPQV